MEILWQHNAPEYTKTECLVLFLDTENTPTLLEKMDGQCNGMLSQTIEYHGIRKKKTGESLFIPVPLTDHASCFLVVALGDTQKNTFDHAELAKKTATALEKLDINTAAICFEKLETHFNLTSFTQLLARAITLSSYKFSCFDDKKTPDEEESKNLQKVSFLYEGDQELKSAIRIGVASGKGMNNTKKLGDLPANICTPSYLAECAKTLSQNNPSLKTEILNEKDLRELNMNAFLAVSQGSQEEGKMVIMHYNGGPSDAAPIVLIGKGVTFDSGGTCIKPSRGLDEMKYDMCGAGTVFGVMSTLNELKPAINVIGIMACVENMTGGGACRPGDVVKSMSGKTVEIFNTDAEGRLILADAITYSERFSPSIVIDIATLTGACIVALGRHNSALMSNDDQLADEIINIGKQVDDTVWRLPLGPLYHQQLESNFSDFSNLGGPDGGSITAACFLEKFAEDLTWAHLDIAGTAWTSGGKNRGATGKPVALLVNFILSKCS